MSNQPPPPPSGASQPYQGGEEQQPYQGEQQSQQAGYPGQHQPNPAPPFNGQQQWQGPNQALPAGDLSDSEARTWSIVAHLVNPIATLFSAGFLGFIGPLVVWAIYKDRSPMVRKASAGAFNFSLTLGIIYIGLWIFGFLTLGFGFIVTVPLMFVLWIVSGVIHVLAAIKAGNNQDYTYPMQLPVLK